MITITHPSATEGTDEVSGLTFVDGKAEVANIDEAARAVLTDHGFTFEGEPEPDNEGEGDDVTEIVGTPLEKLSRADVDAIAAEHGIDVSGARNKKQAIAIIEASGKLPTLGDDDTTDAAPADDGSASDDSGATESADAPAS